MSFSIVCNRAGSYQLVVLRELDASGLSLLRRELASVLSANPTEFEVRVSAGTLWRPKGRRFKSSRPDNLTPRRLLEIPRRRVEGARPIGWLGSNRVANGAALAE
jgi:hypothetical protein